MSGRALRVVLDTNVVLDLLLYTDRRVDALAAMLADGRAFLLADEAGIGELRRVLGYPEFGLDAEAAAGILSAYLERVGTLAPPAAPDPTLPRCRDTDDQKFLDLAARSDADLLLTRDKALLRLAGRVRKLRPGLSIVTPEAWSKSLAAAEGGRPC